MRRLLFAAVASLAIACSSQSADTTSSSRAGFQVYPVAWNVTEANVGVVRALADLDDTIVFFGEAAVSVMVDGEVQGATELVEPFRSAAVIPAADGSGRWVVGIDAAGKLSRVRLHDASLEDVTARYALEGVQVRALAAVSDHAAAFLLDGEIAIADGTTVTRWTVGPVDAIAGGGGRLALLAKDRLRVFDLGSETMSSFPVVGASAVVFGEDGLLHVAVGKTLYREEPIAKTLYREQGTGLVPIYTGEQEIHGVVRSARRVWFSVGSELGTVESGLALVSTGAGIAASSVLVGATSGDVWAIADGVVSRFTAASGGAVETWNEWVKPIFDHNCAACHLPGGTSGIDLSTFDTWNSMRANLMRRVIVERSMPPVNSKALSDPDRTTIRAWLTGQLEDGSLPAADPDPAP